MQVYAGAQSGKTQCYEGQCLDFVKGFFFLPLTFPAYSVSSSFKTTSLTQLLVTTHTMTLHLGTNTHTRARTQTRSKRHSNAWTQAMLCKQRTCKDPLVLCLSHDRVVNMSALRVCVCVRVRAQITFTRICSLRVDMWRKQKCDLWLSSLCSVALLCSVDDDSKRV